MFRVILIVLSAAVFWPAASFAGNCDHSWQSASDGSSCGGRAADQRPGGSDGY